MEVTATKGQIIKGKPVADQISENLIKEVDELVKVLENVSNIYNDYVKDLKENYKDIFVAFAAYMLQ